MPNQFTTPRVPSTCLQCGVEHLVPARLAELRKFCSRACRQAAQKVEATFTCETCRKVVKALPSHASVRKYCGQACQPSGPRKRRPQGCTLSVEERREIAEFTLRNPLVSFADIGRHFKRDPSTVCKVAKEYGLRIDAPRKPPRQKPQPWSEDSGFDLGTRQGDEIRTAKERERERLMSKWDFRGENEPNIPASDGMRLGWR